MDCPRCGAHNETEVGSCLSCGAPLAEVESLPTIAQKPLPAAQAKAAAPRLAQGAPPKQCPNCMTLNAATFKFCARCGTPLGATGAPPAAPTVSAMGGYQQLVRGEPFRGKFRKSFEKPVPFEPGKPDRISPGARPTNARPFSRDGAALWHD